MSCDDNYVLDADGKRILIGLTLDETREFERLDELILIPALNRPMSATRETNGAGLFSMISTTLRYGVTYQRRTQMH